jgi:general secretion pathway protein F
VDAASETAAADLVASRGLYPTTVEPTQPSMRWRAPSGRARAIVLRSLASLLEAGVPLSQALVSTTHMIPGLLAEAVERVATRVREGATLAAAMRQEGSLFSPVTLGLVFAGERGLGLDRALAHAADHAEREVEIRSRIRAALAYPLLLCVVGAVSIALIVGIVVPRFGVMLTETATALPLATRLLLGLSDVARTYGVLLAVLTVAVLALGVVLVRAHPTVWHRWLLDAPVVGPLRHALATGRVCRTLAVLQGAGLSVLQGLEAARSAAADAAVAARLDTSRTQVAEGATLSRALATTRAVTPLAVQLLRIGEGSGRTAALLERAADLEESLAERRLKTLVNLLEPGLILVFAAIVAFVAAALLQAVYGLRPGAL